MEPAAGDFRNFSGVGTNARIDLPILYTCSADVGGDMVFCTTGCVYGCRGGSEESGKRQVPVAQGDVGAAYGGVCGSDWCLVVLAADIKERCGCEGHKRIFYLTKVFEIDMGE